MFSKRKLIAPIVFVFAIGCGPSGPTTHPVNGRVEVTGGDVSALAGSHIEAVHETDVNIRASGEIQPDGSFTLETQHAGNILKGAQPGSYKVRIVLNDDDPAARKRAAKSVDPTFLKLNSTTLSLQVPAPEGVTLTVPARR